jgi:hypothetical protein
MLTHTLLILCVLLSSGAVMNMVANETNSLKFGKGVLVSDPTHALLMLYSCFTHALLMLYSCFTHALLMLYSCFTHATLLMRYSCFTHARSQIRQRASLPR